MSNNFNEYILVVDKAKFRDNELFKKMEHNVLVIKKCSDISSVLSECNIKIFFLSIDKYSSIDELCAECIEKLITLKNIPLVIISDQKNDLINKFNNRNDIYFSYIIRPFNKNTLKEKINLFVFISDYIKSVNTVSNKELFSELKKNNGIIICDKNYSFVRGYIQRRNSGLFLSNFFKNITETKKLHDIYKKNDKSHSRFVINYNKSQFVVRLTCITADNGEELPVLLFRDIKNEIKVNRYITEISKLIDTTGNILLVLNNSGKIVYMNSSACEMLDGRYDEIVYKSWHGYFIGREYFDRVYENLKKILNMENEEYIDEYDIVTLSGQTKRVRFKHHLIEYKMNDELYILCCGDDISYSVEIEKRLNKISAELQKRNEENRRFIYIISHDLRSPLISIEGFTNELKKSIDKVISGIEGENNTELLPFIHGIKHNEIDDYFLYIDKSISRISEMINAVLSLSRVGQRDFIYEMIDLNDIISDIIQSMHHVIMKNNIQVIYKNLPSIECDKVSIKIIFSNLIDNAIKYRDLNRKLIVRISCTKDKDYYYFKVEDNGIGIDDSEIESIFDIFKRIGEREIYGDGMGLAYVKSLILKYGGEIECKSEKNKGSTFYFTINNKRGGVYGIKEIAADYTAGGG